MERDAGHTLKSDFPHKVVAIDANFLVELLTLSKDKADVNLRVAHFISRAEKAKAKIVIPMPAIAEFLVGAEQAGLQALNALERRAYIQMASFDRPAAFECSQIERSAKASGDKKDGSTEPWQRIKVDRQIIAIAKVCGATLIISGDSRLRTTAMRVGMEACDFSELELPPSASQTMIDFGSED